MRLAALSTVKPERIKQKAPHMAGQAHACLVVI
jgi:hypothetical protein